MPAAVLAHGVVGERFFPATLAIDDPFVADELSFPTVSITKLHGTAEELPTLETDFSTELSKRLSPDLGISLGATVLLLAPDHGATIAGFDNMAKQTEIGEIKSHGDLSREASLRIIRSQTSNIAH